MEDAVELGSKVKDSITGFKGVAIARCTYLYGCVHVQVEASTLTDGKSVTEWFDEQRLSAASKARTGGPQPTPSARQHP